MSREEISFRLSGNCNRLVYFFLPLRQFAFTQLMGFCSALSDRTISQCKRKSLCQFVSECLHERYVCLVYLFLYIFRVSFLNFKVDYTKFWKPAAPTDQYG